MLAGDQSVRKGAVLRSKVQEFVDAVERVER